MLTKGLIILGSALPVFADSLAVRQSSSLEACPGYTASNVQDDGARVTADLALAGTACNVYGQDLTDLRLEVEYQTENRLHVKIFDAAEQVYQIQESIWPRPNSDDNVDPENSALSFSWTASPFSFAITRRETNETLFDTSAASLVFESQYLRLRTSLPDSAHLYGLGEHTDPFQLNTTNYTRTLWNRDAYGTPGGSTLYGSHPVYFDHRGENGTHAVFLASSQGMDIKIDDSNGTYLEYNTLGGIVDLYFFAGSSPKEVSVQYSELSGLPAMMPYWGFGFHQCRYGYRDVWDVAETVANYSLADIALETMWTDIDYMELRRLFTLDPERYPLEMVRELVDYLHQHQQHYIVMVNSAVWRGNGSAYNAGLELDVFQKRSNGSIFEGAVWPGPTVFPDWSNPSSQQYWDEQFESFFDPAAGVDIDGLWNDMNEPANFCPYPCVNPEAYSDESKNPPEPPAVRENAGGRTIPGFPASFQPQSSSAKRSINSQYAPSTKRSVSARQSNGTAKFLGLPGRDLINPGYQIDNAAGSISNHTLDTDILNYDGTYHYDTHNFWGSQMSIASRESMLKRRPESRPLLITRSTFVGLGKYVGKWLGDNVSLWEQYRFSIAGVLNFASIYQIPMVGTDICGFAGNTTETLCARWAALGAFYPFMRNHNGDTSISQEFYRWPLTIAAARKTIAVRYRLLDYLYTSFHRQTETGLPVLNPLFFHYPEDANTFAIEHQFFYGDDILVSPVLEENSTSVSIYLPNAVFYDYWTLQRIQGNGSYVNLTNIGFDSIPLHIRGGAILPLRAESANTTTELRKQDFVLWIAPNATNQASGTLYLDDGDSIEQAATSNIVFTYDNGAFSMTGDFGYDAGVSIKNITVLGTGQSVQGPVALTGAYSHRFNATGTGSSLREFTGAASKVGVGALMGAVAGAAMLVL
ncbi:glycoside hydrolase family 31 protein [Dothidotthia symphoricarpi CBS 119687]|uniref:Probable alpha/beta-glucosidase agdC n=1 Tax=Dothidotthia symphoricarpi CBS 119687 TaxID=1392245 RepID=A0A6A6A323_9PLEO|nr:glycoside hydrolase family 31 protein [Dothidotthia symphoricarpi CBS 119687]KAF2126412.1 glycoside hydrolase family 31 protein [Dothidotthia symphoricarpi CBS 119687]